MEKQVPLVLIHMYTLSRGYLNSRLSLRTRPSTFIIRIVSIAAKFVYRSDGDTH